MSNKGNTRITIDIPTIDHKRLKLLAAYHGKSMREVFIEIIEQGLEYYQEICAVPHDPNEITQKAIESVKNKKNLEKTDVVQDLFKKLSR
jgi:plasmid stability protein